MVINNSLTTTTTKYLYKITKKKKYCKLTKKRANYITREYNNIKQSIRTITS